MWQLTLTPSAYAWSLVSNGSVAPSTSSPNARSQMSVAAIPDGRTFVLCGFSGYTGGLNDMFHNDVWQYFG